jgi:hypothetical protein
MSAGISAQHCKFALGTARISMPWRSSGGFCSGWERTGRPFGERLLRNGLQHLAALPSLGLRGYSLYDCHHECGK